MASSDRLTMYRRRLEDVADEPLQMLPPIRGFQDVELVSLEKAVECLVRLIPDVMQQASRAKKNCNKLSEHGLTVDESASIWLYTYESNLKEKSLYNILNATLRSEDRSILKVWFPYMKLFVTGLLKIPSSEQHVYRGVPLNLADKYETGESIVWWAFSSTSSNPKTAKKFSKQAIESTVFEIDCYFGKDIKEYSCYPQESEILLIAATHFYVVSNQTVSNGKSIIHLKETEPKFPLIDKGPVKLSNFSKPSELSGHTPNNLPPSNFNKQDKLQGYTPTTEEPGNASSQPNRELRSLIDRALPRANAMIDGQPVNREDMKYIVEELIVRKQCPSIEIHNVRMTHENITKLAEGINQSATLNIVNLRGNFLTDKDVSCLVEELSIPHKKPVKQEGCCGFSSITVINCGEIKVLDLGNNKIDNQGMKQIVKLMHAKQTLTELHLDGNNFGDEAVRQLCSILSLPTTNLRKLYLHNNKGLTDKTVDYLAEMLKTNQCLTTLHLYNCSLTDQGKKKLDEASKLRKGFYANIERCT